MRGLLYLFVLCTAPLSAQSFFPVGEPLLEQEVELQQANECYIYFDNPSGDSLYLHWRKIEVGMPNGWDIDLCDFGNCYIGIPDNANMNVVYDTIQPYLKLIVQPETVEGSGWLWFRVSEAGNPDNYQDVYFSVYTDLVTSTVSITEGDFSFFPNPAQDVLTVQNNKMEDSRVRILDLNGRVLKETLLSEHSTESIPLDGIPAGLYLIQSGAQVKQLVIQPNH